MVCMRTLPPCLCNHPPLYMYQSRAIDQQPSACSMLVGCRTCLPTAGTKRLETCARVCEARNLISRPCSHRGGPPPPARRAAIAVQRGRRRRAKAAAESGEPRGERPHMRVGRPVEGLIGGAGVLSEMALHARGVARAPHVGEGGVQDWIVDIHDVPQGNAAAAAQPWDRG